MKEAGKRKDQTGQYLGIDIGGSRVKWGLLDRTGAYEGVDSFETRVEDGREAFLDSLCSLINRNRQVAGVGLCCPGVVDSESGVVRKGVENIPFLQGFAIKPYLAEKTGQAIELINDVNAVALGEHWVGAGKGCHSLFCISIGTGVGGSLLIDGKLHTGHNLMAGEIGYMNYRNEGDYLEKTCSAKALIDLSSQAFGRELTPGQLFDYLAAQDPMALAVFEKWVDGLATVIANIALVVDPQLIILGGGITERGDDFLKPLTRSFRRKMPDRMAENYPLVLADCKNNAGIIGAVRHFLVRRQEADEEKG